MFWEANDPVAPKASFPDAEPLSFVVRRSIKGVGFSGGTGNKTENHTNIKYEQRLCHEYRAGLEAGAFNNGEKSVGPWSPCGALPPPSSPHSIDPPPQRGRRPDDRLQAWLYVHHDL